MKFTLKIFYHNFATFCQCYFYECPIAAKNLFIFPFIFACISNTSNNLNLCLTILVPIPLNFLTIMEMRVCSKEIFLLFSFSISDKQYLCLCVDANSENIPLLCLGLLISLFKRENKSDSEAGLSSLSHLAYL